MAYAAVMFLLDNLTELKTRRKTLIHDAETDILALENEVMKLKHFLEMVQQEQKQSQKQSILVKEIEEAVYDVEEIIDSFVSRTVLAKSGSIFSMRRSTSRGTKILEKIGLKSHVGLGEEVRLFMSQTLTPLTGKLEETSPGGRLNVVATPNHRPISGYYNRLKVQGTKQDLVVGLKDEMKTLIGYLQEQAEEFEVISITGTQGIGKTTMARRIFEHPKIQKEFPTCIWVNVSEELNMMDVLISIMKAFTKQDMSDKNLAELSQLVPKYLEMGKFLLVLDDVRTVGAWKQIREVFPVSKTKRGKILITTCDRNVAVEASILHQLRTLDEGESWELLRFQVFGEMIKCPGDLESVGKRIAKNCHGFPLSLVVIGGILFDIFAQGESAGNGNAQIQKEWKRIAESPEANIPLDAVPSRIDALIRWSYDSLSPDLKDCFLYVGMFPADTKILASKLTHLWIAEGFVRRKQDKTLDEVAKENLLELINRNLLMVERFKVGGEVKSCRVHDTVRLFCKTEALKRTGNLFQEIKNLNLGSSQPQSSDVYPYRRLCIHSYPKEFLSGKPDISKVRSFLCFSKLPTSLGPEDIEYLGHTFNMARVLEAIDIQLPKFPLTVTNLVHLRYITLSCKEFSVLPEAVSNLWYLQTLIVETSSRTLEIKGNIWKMMHLRYLKTQASISLKKAEGEGDGDNLQIIGRLSPQSFTDQVYKKKPKNLYELGIRGTLSDTLCFENLSSLEHLRLQHDVSPKKESENPLSKLPPSNKFPPKLRYLVLTGTYLRWECITTLAELGRLQVLKLKDNAFSGDSWDVGLNGFKSLEALCIKQADLKFWTAKVDSFPKLRTLELEKCERLQEVPVELGATLETMSMYRVTRFAISYARKIEQARAEKGGFKLQIYTGDI